MGLIVLWKLDRDIQSAKWLSQEEKDLLQKNVGAGRENAPESHSSFWKVLVTREVAIFAFVYFGIKMASYGLNFWMPHLIAQSGVKDILHVGLLTALPYAVACVGMVWLTRRSDRTGDRKFYLLLCMLASTVGYILACLYSNNPVVLMASLILATSGSFIAIPIFWCLPQSTFSGIAIASAVAAVNSTGQLSGMIAPAMVGFINDLTGQTYMGMLAIVPVLLACCYVIFRYVRNPSA